MNKPITPKEMKAYVDATWKKCQAEAWGKQPEQKPVKQDLQAPLTLNGVALYPRQKPLSDEEIGLLTTGDDWAHFETPALAKFARAVEAAHGIKGDA